jgi:hypothetical protein
MILACFALIVFDRGQSIGTKPIKGILSAPGPAFVARNQRVMRNNEIFFGATEPHENEVTLLLQLLFCVTESIELGLVGITAAKPFGVTQKVAHRGEETADLLGVYQTVVGSQE